MHVPCPDAPDVEWVSYLASTHSRELPRLRALDDEYELKSTRAYMHPEIMRELGERLQQVVIAWPQLVVDSLDERLDVEGFRLPGDEAGDDELWRIWQENGADEESQLGHVDALVMKRSYIAVGTNEADASTPLMTWESPLEVFADVDPRTRQARAALRRWCSSPDPQLPQQIPDRATLYRPNVTVYYEDGREVDRDEHNLGVVPIVPMVNRGRLADRFGRSELDPVLPLARAANKIATDMMVAAEFVALPLRGIFGIGPDDLEDGDGNKMTALQAILGRLLTIPGDPAGVEQFEFKSADLSNFHGTINLLANLVAAIAGLDPAQLGIHTDSPASADAIRAREARLVKRAERKQRAFGGAHEQAMRLVRRIQDGDWDPKLRRMETIWRDASTPTVAQKADAAVKLHAEGITTTRQAREDIGYSDTQIRRMEAEEAEEGDRLLGIKPAMPPTVVPESVEPVVPPAVEPALAA